MTPRLLLVRSESWTMTWPRDLRALVRIAAATERLRLLAGAVIAPLRVLRSQSESKRRRPTAFPQVRRACTWRRCLSPCGCEAAAS
jgi:hypothetical protein